MVSTEYLGLCIFLQALLILVWTSSNLAFHMMHSAYKLNKQGDNIQPFPIWNQSVVLSLLYILSSILHLYGLVVSLQIDCLNTLVPGTHSLDKYL